MKEAALPELARIVIEAGPDGEARVVQRLLSAHPGISKRQATLKLHEIAVKRRAHDPFAAKGKGAERIVWQLRPAFARASTRAKASRRPRAPRGRGLRSAAAASAAVSAPKPQESPRRARARRAARRRGVPRRLRRAATRSRA